MAEVDYAEPNGYVYKHQGSTFSPNDRLFRIQWNFRMIGASRTWAIQKGSTDVAVAVLDTGIAYEDFGAFRKAKDWGSVKFLPGIDTVNGDSHPNDDELHGTHVASTVAEATNNELQVAGLAFGCSIMPVKVLDAEGRGTNFELAEGLDYVTNFRQGGTNPVKVINMSLGGPSTSETIRRAIDRASQAGILLVASAGTDDDGTVEFPANLDNVIAVGAVDGRRQRAFYSNYGSALDVVAPGGDNERDDDGDGVPDYVFQQTYDPDEALLGRYDQFVTLGIIGTSSAAPHVAALAALLFSQGIGDARAVRAAIEQTADDLGTPGRDDQFGHGLINPAKALSGVGLNK
jgi:serine protease